MNASRKRIRSEEDDFSIQSKCFVNQQLVDRNDEKLMKGVYEKTLKFLFAGAKLECQRADASRQQPTESHPLSPVLDTVDDKPSEPKGCMLCWKDVEATPSPDFMCKNCNLRICVSCQTNCCGCKTTLCSNCVYIFGCSYNDNPICEECKFYVE